MKFAVLGFLVVLLIGFFVVVWKAARDWRWYNIVAVCITMLLATAFIFPTAGVLKSRAAWHQVKEKLEKQANELEITHRLIKYGDLTNAEYGEGVAKLDQRLSKIGIEVGRRWRNLQFQGFANDQVTLIQAPQAGVGVDGIPEGVDANAAPAVAAQPTALVPQSLVVYGFAETPVPNPNADEQPLLLPTFYLGEFNVEASSPTSVTLKATGPLEANQLNAIQQRQASSWSLYEMLPIDGHEPFIAQGSERTDDNYFGRVDTETVDQLFEIMARVSGRTASEATLEAYREDGRRAEDSDPPLSRWWFVEFVKDHALEVDSPETWPVLESGFFDANGRAVDARLQRTDGNEVRFKRGDQVLVKEEAGIELRDEGVAELRDTFFLRPLNDYQYVLRRIRLRLTELKIRQTELEFDTKVIEDAIAKTEGMLVANQDSKLKLEQDLAQFRIEKVAVTSYTEQLREQVKTMRDEMARLHQQNLVLEQQIEEKQLAIEQRLNSLTLLQ